MLRGRTGEARSLSRTAPSKALDERTERAEGLPDASPSSLSSATCVTEHHACLMSQEAEGLPDASTSNLFSATCIIQYDACLMSQPAERWHHTSTFSLFKATCTATLQSRAWCDGHSCISCSMGEVALSSCDPLTGASL